LSEFQINLNDYISIQSAIDAIADKNGGELIVSEGEHLTGPINLCSNLTLTLEEGAVLKFYDDPMLYTPVWTRWEGVECYAMHPLVYADSCKNIRIQGKGTIDGCGAAWWAKFKTNEDSNQNEPIFKYEKRLAELNPGYENEPSGGGRRQTQFLRPSLIQFWKCENVVCQDFTLKNSPFWTLHMVYTKNIVIKDMHIFNPSDAINTDAMDIDSCESVVIKGCLLDVGDDAVTLKSGSGVDGLRVNIPTKDVLVENCKVLASHGGIAIGSETAGGIKDVVVKNCTFEGTQRAIRLKSRRGRGGTLENISLTDLKMDGSWCPVVLGMFFQPGADPDKEEDKWIFSTEPQPVDEFTPHIKNVSLKNIEALNCKSTAAFIVGLPEAPLEDLTIENFTYSLAPEDQLIPTWNTEPTGGVGHDADRGIKVLWANLKGGRKAIDDLKNGEIKK
jgi:polygalacturonase